MNFRFHIGKATEAACLFLERGGGQMNIMKLVKLLYLLDRRSLDCRNTPVIGGDYHSMRNGPVTSEILDLINAGRLLGATERRWEQCITDRKNHDVTLEQMPLREHLADSEVGLLKEVWAEHGGKDQWQLVDWVMPTAKNGPRRRTAARLSQRSKSAWIRAKARRKSTGCARKPSS